MDVRLLGTDRARGRGPPPSLSPTPARKRWPWAVALASTLAILIATLFRAGSTLPRGWSFALAAGDAALAELIQNLLLFIPLGASLALAGVRPRVAIALGAALSFGVEFAQQWIPGRDPSAGDIVCNTISTAIGVGLVPTVPRWLFTTPQRSARQALAAAIAAVVVWAATGLVLRLDVKAPPYQVVTLPDFPYFGRYQGKLVEVSPDMRLPFFNPRDRRIEKTWAFRATLAAAPRPPSRTAPLVAVLDPRGTRIVMLSIDGNDLTLRYHMPAVDLRLEQPDLRWRGALRTIAPGDTFTTAAVHDRHNNCVGLTTGAKCDLGFTVGDGWKLIFYPERFPTWALTLINALWIAGWTMGIGYWGRRAVMGNIAIAIAIIALVLVPPLTGLKATPWVEWVGGLAGVGTGYLVKRRLKVSARSDTLLPPAS